MRRPDPVGETLAKAAILACAGDKIALEELRKVMGNDDDFVTLLSAALPHALDLAAQVRA